VLARNRLCGVLGQDLDGEADNAIFDRALCGGVNRVSDFEALFVGRWPGGDTIEVGAPGIGLGAARMRGQTMIPNGMALHTGAIPVEQEVLLAPYFVIDAWTARSFRDYSPLTARRTEQSSGSARYDILHGKTLYRGHNARNPSGGWGFS
jgi:hypothetical protein